MKPCPFCNIENQRLLQESELAQVFFSNPRLMKGHLLVTPKRHVEEPWELTDAEANEIFTLIRVLQKRLSETLGTGCDVRQNYRPFLPQGRIKIDHVHYHLMPRTLNDELYEKCLRFENELFRDLDLNEVTEVTSQLKKKAA